MVQDSTLPTATGGRRMGVSSRSLTASSAGVRRASLPKIAKTESERHDIVKLIRASHDTKIHMMMGPIPRKVLEEIVEAMIKKTVAKGSVLLDEGDEGLIYIVESGCFDVFEQPQPEPGEDPAEAAKKEPVKVFEATVGYSVGEEIGQSMARSVKVIAQEDSEVWGIEVDAFRSVVVSSADEQFREHCRFLKNCDIFSELTDDQIAALAEVAMEEDFENDEAIVEQDDRDTNMFILREGSGVAIIRGPQGEVEVAKYGPGDYFGEIALLLGKSRQATVLAQGPTICLYINRESFNRLLGPLRDILARNIEKYQKYQELIGAEADVGLMHTYRSRDSTPRNQHHEEFDGSWDKNHIRGQTFRKKVAKTFARLPETGLVDQDEEEDVVATVSAVESEPRSLKEKIDRDFTKAALVEVNRSFALQHCSIQAFGGLRLGEHFTVDKTLITKTDMTPQREGFEDHFAWSCPSWTKGGTHIAALCQKGHKAADDPTPNQDNYFLFHTGAIQVYGVADGHGPFGHLVSFRLVQTLPYFLMNNHHAGKDWETALKEAFLSAQSDLQKFAQENRVNIEASGAAGSVIVFDGPAVHVAHIGDAGAMVGSWNRRDSSLRHSTNDHKPQVPEERARLEAAGSDVREVDEDSFRIYRKGTDFPGLTMSRAFGDTACNGVLQEPEYHKLLMQPSDEYYAIIASDGIWEFLTYEKTLELSAKKLRLKGPAEVARFLIEASRKRWKIAAGDYCDDITIIVIQWNVKLDQAETNCRCTLKRHEEMA